MRIEGEVPVLVDDRNTKQSTDGGTSLWSHGNKHQERPYHSSLKGFLFIVRVPLHFRVDFTYFVFLREYLLVPV